MLKFVLCTFSPYISSSTIQRATLGPNHTTPVHVAPDILSESRRKMRRRRKRWSWFKLVYYFGT